MRNSKSLIVGFLTDSVLKFSAEIEIFIGIPKTEFLHFLINIPVQCCPEKANFLQIVCSWYLMKRFSEWCTILCIPR